MRLSALVHSDRTRKNNRILPDHLTKDQLSRFLPEASLEYVCAWFRDHNVRLVLKRSRASKSGDYRFPANGSAAVISMNHNLNRFHFLITLLHEMAHHEVHLDDHSIRKSFFSRKNRPRPHGPEWQNHFRNLVKPLLDGKVFPPGLKEALEKHLQHPKASTIADHCLQTVLQSFDRPDGTVAVEEIPVDALFRLPDGRVFRKKEKIRKRFRCTLSGTRKTYLFQPGTRVFQF